VLVDPLFQRTLVAESRARGVPVIFDEVGARISYAEPCSSEQQHVQFEMHNRSVTCPVRAHLQGLTTTTTMPQHRPQVFSGLWRLGVPSAALLLGAQPDIACYAKLLTGVVCGVNCFVAKCRSSAWTVYQPRRKWLCLETQQPDLASYARLLTGVFRGSMRYVSPHRTLHRSSDPASSRNTPSAAHTMRLGLRSMRMFCRRPAAAGGDAGAGGRLLTRVFLLPVCICPHRLACLMPAGGLLPLAVTLATEEVFRVFEGPAKTDALLHGHSYTAHPMGCAAAVAALDMYGDPAKNPRQCRPAGWGAEVPAIPFA